MRKPRDHDAALLYATRLASLPDGEAARARAMDRYAALVSETPKGDELWRDIAVIALQKWKLSRDARVRREGVTRRLRSAVLILILWWFFLAATGVRLSGDQNLVICALLILLFGAWIYIKHPRGLRHPLFDPHCERNALNQDEKRILREIGERGDLPSS